jgi:hypothetical protein
LPAFLGPKMPQAALWPDSTSMQNAAANWVGRGAKKSGLLGSESPEQTRESTSC